MIVTELLEEADQVLIEDAQDLLNHLTLLSE